MTSQYPSMLYPHYLFFGARLSCDPLASISLYYCFNQKKKPFSLSPGKTACSDISIHMTYRLLYVTIHLFLFALVSDIGIASPWQHLVHKRRRCMAKQFLNNSCSCHVTLSLGQYNKVPAFELLFALIYPLETLGEDGTSANEDLLSISQSDKTQSQTCRK